MPDRSDGLPIGVLQVISNLEYGGAQRQVIELANNLDERRFDVHVCSLSDYVPLGAMLRDAERRLHIIRKRAKYDLTVVPRLARLLRRLGTRVVHGYLFDAEIASRLAGRLAGVPLIVGSERNTDYVMKRSHKIVYRMTRSWCDLVVANSRAGAEFNRRMLGHDVSQYRVVHNGVDTERFRPGDGRAVRHELGITDDESVVGMFGSFKAQKNHPLLIAAAKLVLDRQPQTRFLFVGEQLYGGMHGSDQYRQKIDALVTQSGIRSRCLFAGNRNDVERLYAACDVTVLPSLFEGTPNVLLESMACGVPVVATDVSDNADIAPDGQVGYIVPLNDPQVMAMRIVSLVEDPELQNSFGARARTWVEQRFSVRRLIEQMAEVYRGN